MENKAIFELLSLPNPIAKSSIPTSYPKLKRAKRKQSLFWRHYVEIHL